MVLNSLTSACPPEVLPFVASQPSTRNHWFSGIVLVVVMTVPAAWLTTRIWPPASTCR